MGKEKIGFWQWLINGIVYLIPLCEVVAGVIGCTFFACMTLTMKLAIPIPIRILSGVFTPFLVLLALHGLYQAFGEEYC